MSSNALALEHIAVLGAYLFRGLRNTPNTGPTFDEPKAPSKILRLYIESLPAFRYFKTDETAEVQIYQAMLQFLSDQLAITFPEIMADFTQLFLQKLPSIHSRSKTPPLVDVSVM